MSIIIDETGPTTEEALLSDDPVVRVMARAADAEWLKLFQAWFSAECRRPDMNALDLMKGLIVVQIQLHSGLLHQFFKPGADETWLECYNLLLDIHYVEHARRAREQAGRVR